MYTDPGPSARFAKIINDEIKVHPDFVKVTKLPYYGGLVVRHDKVVLFGYEIYCKALSKVSTITVRDRDVEDAAVRAETIKRVIEDMYKHLSEGRVMSTVKSN